MVSCSQHESRIVRVEISTVSAGIDDGVAVTRLQQDHPLAPTRHYDGIAVVCGDKGVTSSNITGGALDVAFDGVDVLSPSFQPRQRNRRCRQCQTGPLTFFLAVAERPACR